MTRPGTSLPSRATGILPKRALPPAIVFAVLFALSATQSVARGQRVETGQALVTQQAAVASSQVGVFTGSLAALPKLSAEEIGKQIVEAERAEMRGFAPSFRQGADEYPYGKPILEGLGPSVTTPASFLNPVPSFEGIAFTGFTPPDTNGDVGPNHYIQMVNASFQIWDKAGTSLAGPSLNNSLFTSLTGPCRDRNRGDPIVNYDHLADRWLLSQFTGLRMPDNTPWPDFHQCVAISRGPDPVNDGWYVYDFLIGTTFFNDYPKIGVWPDGYYMSSQRGFPGGDLDVYVMDRANMLNGNPATIQHFQVGGNPALILMPADLNGPPPAAGAPAPFIRHVDGDLWGGADRLEIFEFHTDWGVPASSTFGIVASIPVAAFSAECGGGGGLNQNCITQPGTGNTVDSLSPWTMWRLQYRHFGDRESMVVNHTIDVDGSDHAGVRWYELRNTGGGWGLHQQGTFAPDAGAPGLADDPHRFMGSIAMDQAGNIALGYAASSSTLFPEVRYAGRMASDPLGLLPHGEVTLQIGGGSQTGSQRYGDYSAMQVDPVDDCTFWYTQEYIPAGGAWQTRIGAFRFSNCNQADLRISKSASPSPATAGGDLFYSITVTNDGPAPANNVTVVDTLPAGVTFVANTDSCVSTAPPPGEFTCSLGTIASGASKNFTLQVKIASNITVPGGPTSITNTAVVSADEEDPDTSNNTASVTTLVEERADLQLIKVCKPDNPLAAGATATCTITVQNLGPSDARGVIVTDTHLSNGAFTITSATFTPPPNSPCGIAGGVVTCNLGVEPAGGTSTITVQFTSNDGVDVNDVAVVTSITPDPDPDNNIGQGHVTFTGSSNLSITKTDTPDPVVAGTNLTYVITVGNAGPSVAPNVVVRDTLPAALEVLTVTPSVGSCTNGIPGDPLQPLRCTLGALANAANATITIVAKVNSTTPNGTTINNNATVRSDNEDPNNANNSFSATTAVVARADMELLLTSDKPDYKPSSVVTYTVVVRNNGPSKALAVQVTDTLPDLKAAIYQSDTGGCTKSANILTCNVGDLNVGETRNFNIYLLVKGNKGTITDTAVVTSPTVDPVPANNTKVLDVLVKK